MHHLKADIITLLGGMVMRIAIKESRKIDNLFDFSLYF